MKHRTRYASNLMVTPTKRRSNFISDLHEAQAAGIRCVFVCEVAGVAISLSGRNDSETSCIAGAGSTRKQLHERFKRECRF
jgi:hypothetical protein